MSPSIASGRSTMVTSPSTLTHSPKNPSLRTTSQTRGSRRRFLTLTAVSRLETTAYPSSSTDAVMGDSCGVPSRPSVAMMARWLPRRNSRALSGSKRCCLGAGGGAAPVVLVHDGAGVAVGQVVLVGQPVHPLLEAKQAGTVVQTLEPGGEVAPGHLGDSRQK